MQTRNQPISEVPISASSLAGKKILFANFPGDGHFNPLTGLAAHLRSAGADVRWYTSTIYAGKIRRLGIPHYPLKKAMDVNAETMDTLFPERKEIKGMIRKLNFDIINAFILRGPEYYADLMEIHKEFPFELVVADSAFTGIPFITDLMRIPVAGVGVFPLTETSKDLAPAGLAVTPSNTFFGRTRQAFLRLLAKKVIFRKPNNVMRKLFAEYGIEHHNLSVFDLLIRKSDVFLQSGTPGFEYFRSDLGANIRYIGPLLPQPSVSHETPWFDARLNQYADIIIVTQGTVERNTEKIITPVLEAFKNTDTLVIATTGGSGTYDLRKRYPFRNLIIEDFIPFGDIMPYADVYITNGGYGGVMLGIENRLPLIVAGVHEGKNEINARVGYFNLGINLKTEWPKPGQIQKAVKEILANPAYRENVVELSEEFGKYDPNRLTEFYLKEIFAHGGKTGNAISVKTSIN